MNHDFFPSSFLHLTELQPVNPYLHHHHHHHYGFPQASAGGPSPYEMTAGGCGGAGDAGGGLSASVTTPAPSPMHPHHQDSRKRRINSYVDNYDSMSDASLATSSTANLHVPSARKRKTSSYGTASAYDDDEDGEDSRSTRTLPDKKQNHSEIEKRRRDKMNTYISELSAMIPMCGAMARKLDKLTVLRMAVQHLRSVRGALSACPLASRPRPSFITERELNALVLHAAHDAFVFVVGCDRGRLMYLSQSITNILHYEQSELLGQSLFDILHPKDVAKVKEQLSSSDLSPRERLIDAKTMLPVKAEFAAGASRLCPGARRSFYCRIKCKPLISPQHPATPAHPNKEEADNGAKMRKKPHDKKYCIVQCTGYLKSWAPMEISECNLHEVEGDEASNLTCLVAVGRTIPDFTPPLPAPDPVDPSVPVPPTRGPLTRPLQYGSRHAIDGKYLFVDQRVTLALGYLPQEVLGTSLYEFVSSGELGAVARTHKHALLRRQPLLTPAYGARRKDGARATLQTQFKPFRNPWTKDVECLLAQNTLVSDAQPPATDTAYTNMMQQKSDGEVQRLIDSQVESHKIGSAIAEEVLRRNSVDLSPELPAELLHDVAFNYPSLVDNILRNVPLGSGGIRSPSEQGLSGAAGESGTDDRPPSISPPLTIDGNGEAAMAVIMSLLEADAGLGGPVNFSGLPWPLP